MNAPTALIVYLTSRCNLNCEFCSAKRDDVVNAKDVTLELIAKVCNLFPSLRVAGIGGNGEPLMVAQLPEVVRFLRKKMSRIRMTTNGVLICERSSEVPWAMFDEISVSVNEVDEQKYIELCGANRLYDVTSGIHELLKQRASLNISFVLSKRRLYRISDYFAYAKFVNAPLVQLFNMVPLAPGGNWLKQMDEDILFDDPEVMEELRRLKSLARAMGVNVRWPLLVRRDGLGADCREPFSLLGINGNGDVAVCCRGPGPRPEVGNVYKSGNGVWESAYACKLRESIKRKEWETKCIGCKFRYKNVQPKW